MAVMLNVEQREQAIAAAWQEVFQRDAIGLEENFFELGGNSVIAMDLVELVSARVGVEVPVLSLFRHPTIRELSEVIASELIEDAAG